jgi:DnaJ family protein B protein 12
MEVNKEEALRCLHIAQRHRNSSNLPSAIKFARKSVSLFSTPEGEAMVSILQREIAVSEQAEASGSGAATPDASAGSSSSTKASGVEEHLSSAKQRPGHTKPAAPAGGSAGTSAAAAAAAAEKSKKREYTPKQMEVVKRVKGCKHHEYYEILSSELFRAVRLIVADRIVERTCEESDVKRSYKKLALALHPDKNGAPGADEAFKSRSLPMRDV